MRWALVRPVIAAVVLLLPFVALYQAQMHVAAPTAQQQPVGTLSGQADVLRAGASDWQSASKDNIYVGDTIRAAANTRLELAEGTVLEMDPAALVVVKDVKIADGSAVVLHQAGRLHVDTNNPAFRLEGPSLALTVARASFRVEVSDAGDAYVATENGLVYSASAGEVIAVAAGESLRTGVGRRANLQPTTPIVLPPPPPPPPRTPTPSVTPVPPTQPPQRVHIITQGDTLSYLATKYNVTVEAIIKINNVEDPNMLSLGQKLIIPPSK